MSTAYFHAFEILLESGEFPCERLHVITLSGREHISQLFRFEITLASRDPAGLDPKAVGATATLVFLLDGVELRRVHGMIAEVTDSLDSETAFGTYRLVFVPRAWRLTLVETQEIYIDQSVPEIIRQKLEQVGLAEDFELRLLGDYPRREFVVQYRETDLAFISRLVEHLGVSFFFEHREGRDRLVFTDHPHGFPPLEGAARLHFRPRGEQIGVYRLDITSRVIPALYVVSDYNYERPQVDLTSNCELKDGYGGGVIEWGTHFQAPEQGAVLAQIRAQERLVDSLSVGGESAACAIAAGGRFVLEDHPRLSHPQLLVIEVEHHARQAVLGGDADEKPHYRNTFRTMPASATYRPHRLTPRPRIHGVQSGIIDTAPGVDVEHPWLDQHGRYMVRVLFDTAASAERKASLPIRMAQPHSGPNYGIHFPLRPGVEVLLVFVDGDPDRPIIVGSVPNAITPTPVFDAEPTMHRIRTASGVLVEIDDGA
jgi:type VI secretion system secreted protein VgrG